MIYFPQFICCYLSTFPENKSLLQSIYQLNSVDIKYHVRILEKIKKRTDRLGRVKIDKF